MYRERSMLKLSVFPEDIAEAIYFFASDMSAKSTGNIINVDAGNARALRGRSRATPSPTLPARGEGAGLSVRMPAVQPIATLGRPSPWGGGAASHRISWEEPT
jgi:hypothetical protein